MIRPIYSIIVLLLICTTLPGTISAQQNNIYIDSLRVKDGDLTVSYHIEELFDRSLLESMNKGIAVSILYQVTLWRDRGTWFDKNEALVETIYRVKYNKFNRRYTWISISERRTTTALSKIENLCAVQTDIPIIPIDELNKDGQYYISVKGILKPHSIEDFDDVKDWLSGEVDDVDLKNLRTPKRSQEKVSGRIFSVFKNITGLGDKVYDGTSMVFTVTPQGTVRYTKKIILK